MIWTKRSDMERDMIKYCNGAMLMTRTKLAGFLGRHPKDKKVAAYLKQVRKIDGRYPICDLSEVIWNSSK